MRDFIKGLDRTKIIYSNCPCEQTDGKTSFRQVTTLLTIDFDLIKPC
jgi:hypothetical protein